MRSEEDKDDDPGQRTTPEQAPTERMPSPISAQILSFCDEELFSETMRSAEVTSCSGGAVAEICCFDDGSLSSDFPPFSSIDASTISAILEAQPQQEQEILLAPSYQPPPPPPPSAAAFMNQTFDYPSFTSDALLPLPTRTLPLPSVFEDDGMLPLGGFMGLDSAPGSKACSFMDQPMAGPFYADRAAPYTLAGTAQEYQADYHGFYPHDGSLQQRVFCGSGESQVFQRLYGDGAPLLGGCNSSSSLGSDVPSLDESSFKVGRLSVEERREKIHRYIKKRNERNFSKKIKYACRKTLADSRPRVRGRFAKNDDFGETTRTGSRNHEEDDDEDVTMKEEEDAMVSSELFAHLGAVNSYKCNYTLESWI
ncbi:uncharacterized protein LOC144710322 [Wolffia australiana]